MRVVLQGLAPGVENHGHAELSAEMLGISRDGGKCLGRRAEQDRVNGGFVQSLVESPNRRVGITIMLSSRICIVQSYV